MEQHDINNTIPTDTPNAEKDAILKLLLLREYINNDKIHDNGDLMDVLQQLQGLYKELGGYLLTPTAELFPRALDYFNTHVEDIRALLIKHEVSGETVEAVTQDYGGVLCGQYTFHATPNQMFELLKKIKPYRAYMADKYVFYFGVMRHYASCVELAARFNEAFRLEGATAETKTAFMDGQYSSIDALCLLSLRNKGFFTVQDFKGVERQQVIEWLDNLEAYAHLGQYSVYYALSSLALSASTEQLQAIQAPEYLHTLTDATQYAEKYTDNVRKRIDGMADKVAETIEAETAKEQEQAKQKVDNWDAEQSKETMRVSNTMLAIQSRPVRAADSEKAQYTAPITVAIQEYAKRRNIKGISPYRVNQVFECINYMLRFGTPTNDGYIKINTTLSAFANECIGWDANQSQKDEIKTALSVLDNLFIVVPRPRKVEAIRLVVLKKISKTDSGVIELEIDVSALAAKGVTQVIGTEEYRELKKMCQSLSQSRFNAIILGKTHQQESTLLDDIFGYTDEIETAKINGETEAQIKKRQENHRRHLSRDKRKLEEMFNGAKESGAILSYNKRQTGTGKYRVPLYVYEWKRKDVADTSTEQDQPDEQ